MNKEKLLNNPPSRFDGSIEEWNYIVKNELISNSGIMRGKNNPMYGKESPNKGNPTGYSHSVEVKGKISSNHSKHWKNKTQPWKGVKRPDLKCAKRLNKLWDGRRGKPSWNSGRNDLPPHSEETKKKMSLAKKGIKKPKIECPHCSKIGGYPQMKQWHFENCKEKSCA